MPVASMDRQRVSGAARPSGPIIIRAPWLTTASRSCCSRPLQVNNLVLWREPKKSAAVLGGVTAVWVVFGLLKLSIITVAAYAVGAAAALAFVASQAGGFIKCVGVVPGGWSAVRGVGRGRPPHVCIGRGGWKLEAH